MHINSLARILETQGSISLDIANRNFSEEDIFEEFFDCCYFHKINFFDCSFEECEFLGLNFDFCVFKNCKFINTIIRKSEITDCKFKNCEFISTQITPRTDIFRTSFKNSTFFNVDLSFSCLYDCEFIEMSLTKVEFKETHFVNPKIKKITSNDLKLSKTEPIRIEITDSSYFSEEI